MVKIIQEMQMEKALGELKKEGIKFSKMNTFGNSFARRLEKTIKKNMNKESNSKKGKKRSKTSG